jgi:hypothetical protein
MHGLLAVADWEMETNPMFGGRIGSEELTIRNLNAIVASCEKAQKEGRWYAHSVESFKSRRNDDTSIAKIAKDEIQKAKTEVQVHEKEARDAEELERNPPGDVQAANRSSYVEGMKHKEKAANEAALDARERLIKSQAGFSACKSALDADTALLVHPDPLENPSNDAEKAEAKADNQQQIEVLLQQIEYRQRMLGDQKQYYASQEAEAKKYPNLDPDNLALVKKHLAEYDDAATTDK